MSSTSVETRMKKSAVEFTATFVGVSGFPDDVGVYTSSPTVELEDSRWSIRLYPGGFDADSLGYISCFISYDSHGKTRAAFKITVLNQKGWKDHQYISEGVKEFTNYQQIDEVVTWGDPRFIARSNLRNR